MKNTIAKGDIYVECTLTFKGKVNATLHQGLTMDEVVHDVIHCGDYEYEIIDGDFTVENYEVHDEYDV